MKIKRSIAFVLICIFLFSVSVFCVSAEEYEEIVKFGTYPQSEVSETQELKNADYDAKGDCVIGNTKYRRVKDGSKNRYFIYEPITWKKSGNTLLSINILECKMYDEQEEKIKNFMGGIKYAYDTSWEECSVRGWLNNEFKGGAFTSDESNRISGEVRLWSVEEAKQTDKNERLKTATDYALCVGTETNNTGYSEWFLKDISPVTASTVCTVEKDGDINTDIRVLVNAKGVGIVPCVALSDFTGVDLNTEKAPERVVEMYYPGGRTAEFPESQINNALNEGWLADKNEAQLKSGANMKERFLESSLNSSYKWRLYTPKNKQPYIVVEAQRENMSASQIIAFIKPIMDTFYTGNMNDYMEVHAEFVYDKEDVGTYDEFSKNIGEPVHDAIEACWSGWGNIICSDGGIGRLTGTSGAKHTVTLRLKINGDGEYSLSKTNYNNVLHTLANEARAYSERPIGQLQYLRNYYGQNTLYDGNLFTNEPNTLITNGRGICGSYANFTADFCKLLGIPCVIYTNDAAMHAWNGVYIEGKWYEMDHTGNMDKEFMRTSYANYSVNGNVFGFNASGFPSEHNAENVSFLMDRYLSIDNLSAANVAYVKETFATGEGNVTVSVTIPDMQKTEEKEITVLLNGEKLAFDVYPVIEDGRTLVPMRKIFESLGATVYWNEGSRTATGVKGVTVVSISVNSKVLTKNGENITLDVPARLINSRTLVPIRVIAESFGLKVDWDAANRNVIING